MKGLVPTHVKGFDEAIGGGVPHRHIVLLRGAAGTMKSTIAFYIAHLNALDGERTLYITLEQSPRGILEQMVDMGIDAAESSENLQFMDLSRGREQLDSLAGRLQSIEESANSVKARHLETLLVQHVERIQREGRYSVLVIDSWDSLDMLLEFENRRLDTFRLFEWLRGLGLTCFLISETVPQSRREESVEVEYLADAIVNLRLDLAGPNEYQRRIQCMKMRGMNHSAEYFTLVYDSGRFEIVKSISGVQP